jgi:putative transposase
LQREPTWKLLEHSVSNGFERVSKKHYRTRHNLRAGVFDHMEKFSDPRRRQFTIGYLSPVQLENLKCA